MYPKGTEKSAVWQDPELSWSGVAGAGRAAREHHLRRAYGAGPCPYAHPDSAEVCGGRGDWVYQGQECHRRGAPAWWTTKKLQWGTLLGAEGVSHVLDPSEGSSKLIPIHEEANHQI